MNKNAIAHKNESVATGMKISRESRLTQVDAPFCSVALLKAFAYTSDPLHLARSGVHDSYRTLLQSAEHARASFTHIRALSMLA